MQRRVRVGAAHGFLIRRDNVVVVVPQLVIPHGGVLRHLPHHVKRDGARPVFRRGRGDGKFQIPQRLAHIPAGAFRQIVQRVLRDEHRDLVLRAQPGGGVLQAHTHIGGGERLELKHCAAGQQRVVYIKIRILGGGGDQRDGALLHTFQKALLLALVEILDLIQIQQNAAAAAQRTDLAEHRFDVAGGGGGAVELVQAHPAARRDDAGHRGLANAGGAVKNHVGDFSAFHRAAEHLIGAKQMLLAADLLQRAGTKALCEWFHKRILLNNCHTTCIIGYLRGKIKKKEETGR